MREIDISYINKSKIEHLVPITLTRTMEVSHAAVFRRRKEKNNRKQLIVHEEGLCDVGNGNFHVKNDGVSFTLDGNTPNPIQKLSIELISHANHTRTYSINNETKQQQQQQQKKSKQ